MIGCADFIIRNPIADYVSRGYIKKSVQFISLFQTINLTPRTLSEYQINTIYVKQCQKIHCHFSLNSVKLEIAQRLQRHFMISGLRVEWA